MRILITGSSGFVGSRLVERLREADHTIIEMQRYTARRVPRPDLIFCDIKDGDLVDALSTANPDLVIHLAALASNDIANHYPVETMQTIAVGTERLVEAMQRVVPKAPLIAASSSEVYSSPGVIGSLNPYTAAKIASEESIRASGLSFVIMRPFNTYGRGLIGLPRFVVDETIHQALTTGHIQLRDPRPLRDFLFREDHVNAYMKVVENIAEPGVIGSTFDFGTSILESIAGMAYMVGKIVGVEGVTFTHQERDGDIPLLRSESPLAHELLGWAPKYSLEDGLAASVEEWRATLGQLPR